MDDERKRIQLETAKLQLEREKLALQSERDRITRNARIADSTREIFQGTAAVGAAAADTSAWLLKALLTLVFRVIGWGLMSLLVCLAIVIFVRKDIPGDIQFKLGYFLGSGGWIIIVIGIIIGFLLQRKTSAPQSAATEQAPMAQPALSAANSQTSGPAKHRDRQFLVELVRVTLVAAVVIIGFFAALIGMFVYATQLVLWGGLIAVGAVVVIINSVASCSQRSSQDTNEPSTERRTFVGSWVGTQKDWQDWRAQAGIPKLFLFLVGMAALGVLIAALERFLK